MKVPETVPPLPRAVDRNRRLPASEAFVWLAKGWRDLWNVPLPSLLYGAGVALVSILIVAGLYYLRMDYALFPALAGFLVVGPALATGLYEKSRRLEAGLPVTLASMIRPEPGTGQHVLFVGAILCTLMLAWMRAAVLLYALFAGWQPFRGLDQIVPMLFGTPMGWALLSVGTVVGALFSAFAFAISVFAIPMVVATKSDAFTAMGTSISLAWNNLPVMLTWGAIVLVLTIASLVTGMVGFVISFPLLGHATWHAYQTIRDRD
ncbi:DUF2189 domain-containing protein [Sinorhizobium sp. BG8]|uniref:DUF2189 domain-containing protein n=1 Tax=Sinorhizobium sp. BG8 TaxID=2613773 RepID=UPI00193D3148|nr:DUF2189 domain-containing protein [Sinorhizobium sp. BG8]QRM55898.1 DUF2189 domain-containing protein [Sinorhizobium sp. BG8]